MSPSKAVLEPLRVRIRRIQFTVGLGFLALVIGFALSGPLMMRLSTRLEALPLELLRFVILLGLKDLWVLVVLPVLCYGAARIIELSPWRTALGATLTGQLFVLAIAFTSNGLDGVVRGWLDMVLEWGMLGAGVVISQRAVLRGRADAGRQAEQARQQAAARKDEYAEFLRDAERAGEKIAQREAAKDAEQGAPAPAQPSAEEAVAPAAPGAETSEQKPQDEQKTPAA